MQTVATETAAPPHQVVVSVRVGSQDERILPGGQFCYHLSISEGSFYQTVSHEWPEMALSTSCNWADVVAT